MKKAILLFVLGGFAFTASAKQVDELLRALNTASHDTEKVALYIDISNLYKSSEPSKALTYANKGYELAVKANYTLGIAKCNVTVAKLMHLRDEYDTAMVLYNKGLDIFLALKDSNGISRVYQSMSSIHFDKGDFDQGMVLVMKAIKIKELIDDKKGLAYALISLSEIQRVQDNKEDALKSLERAYELSKEVDDIKGMAACLNNSSMLNTGMGEFEKAIELRLEALELYRSINDKKAEARALEGLSIIYSHLDETEKSLDFLQQSMAINEEMGNASGIAVNLVNMGELYKSSKQYEKAADYFHRSLKAAEEIEFANLIQHCYVMLYQTYSAMGQYKQAFEYQSLHIELKDSLYSENKAKQIAELQTQYETEKKEEQIKLQNAEIKGKSEEVKRQQLQKIAFAGGFGLMIVLSFVVFRSYRQKRKANEIITHQKEIVEEQNKEILDSINYAKRIQSAILPPSRLVKENLENSFILYMPKDIVAGDFYWFEPFKGNVIFAAADCTGHGVPGAMVSVVCHNALNRSVREFGLTDPANILDKTRELVVETFEASDEEVKDGMDIALCSFNPKTNALAYAGANNALWIYRKGITNIEELEEVVPDKQPIGKFGEETPFTTHQIKLNPGDTFYIFTDGFPDQFGGPKGKKFKYKPFKQLLLDELDKPMEEQRTTISQIFEDWRGELEQVDDVCVIGVRV